MKKIKVLNLHAGIGGNRKGWSDEDVEVTAVELNHSIAQVYQEFYPNDKVVVGDAKSYLQAHYSKFDFIWASPPCQSHSRMRAMASKRGSYAAIMPNLDLYEFVIFLKHFFKGKYVVENVIPYYTPLIQPSGKLGRHLVWSNFDFKEIKIVENETKHNKVTGKTTKYGINLKDKKINVRKDQIIRNCVNPCISTHLFESAFKVKEEEEFKKHLSTMRAKHTHKIFVTPNK